RAVAARVSTRGVNGDPKTFEAERRVQCDLLREVMGDPFRCVAVAPGWRARGGEPVPRLGEAIYEGRSLPGGTLDGARRPILADALEDAGCTEAAILEHCRGPGPHVRGCWVVDLILGKS